MHISEEKGHESILVLKFILLLIRLRILEMIVIFELEDSCKVLLEQYRRDQLDCLRKLLVVLRFRPRLRRCTALVEETLQELSEFLYQCELLILRRCLNSLVVEQFEFGPD